MIRTLLAIVHHLQFFFQFIANKFQHFVEPINCLFINISNHVIIYLFEIQSFD